MAKNPMQRRANISFLLGMLLTLIITGGVIAYLIMQLSDLKEEIKYIESQTAYGYVVSSSIKSGETITADKLKGVKINLNGVSARNIYQSATKNKDGNVDVDEEGNVIYRRFGYDVKAKLNMEPGTILTTDLTYEDEPITADLRIQEYNMLILPSQLDDGEYIDIRLKTPNGTDYVVLSHKQVEILDMGGSASATTILLRMTEDELLTMNGAIIEAYMMNGSMLYAIRYVEPGNQEAAIATYVPPAEIIQLMNTDKNITETAMKQLQQRYSGISASVRESINKQVDKTNISGVISGVQSEISKMQEERRNYLQSLGR